MCSKGPKDAVEREVLAKLAGQPAMFHTKSAMVYTTICIIGRNADDQVALFVLVRRAHLDRSV